MNRRSGALPSIDLVRSLLAYEPESGIFYWRMDRSGGVKAGARAGCLYKTGRRNIRICGHKVYASVLAWFYVTGEWPLNMVDHKNRNKADDRWENLRPATRSQNEANRPKQRNNTSGLKGVSFHKQTGRWCAKIKAAGKFYHAGLFDSPEAAHAAYCEAARKHFGEYAHTGDEA